MKNVVGFLKKKVAEALGVDRLRKNFIRKIARTEGNVESILKECGEINAHIAEIRKAIGSINDQIAAHSVLVDVASTKIQIIDDWLVRCDTEMAAMSEKLDELSANHGQISSKNEAVSKQLATVKSRQDCFADLVQILVADNQNMDGAPQQSKAWGGAHGARYVMHHMPEDWRVTRLPLIKTWLGCVSDVSSVFEFGCNIGANLMAFRELRADIVCSGCDINHFAVKVARSRGFGSVYQSDITEKIEESYDLVFSRGVLIHVAPENLPLVFANMAKSSRRYVLIMEHYSEEFHGLPRYDRAVSKLMNTNGMSYQYYGDFWKVFEENYHDFVPVSTGVGIHVGREPKEGDLYWKIYERRGMAGARP